MRTLKRSQETRRAAELALVRVVHHYGGKPGFVLLGGLVPALLCTGSVRRHAGTTDVDVQVDLEIARGSVEAGRLEKALRNAEFVPGGEHIWRWKLADSPTVVKFELLADLDTEPNEAVIAFDDCDELGAVNLRGTGYAARDAVIHKIRAKDHGTWREAEINVTGRRRMLSWPSGLSQWRFWPDTRNPPCRLRGPAAAGLFGGSLQLRRL